MYVNTCKKIYVNTLHIYTEAVHLHHKAVKTVGKLSKFGSFLGVRFPNLARTSRKLLFPTRKKFFFANTTNQLLEILTMYVCMWLAACCCCATAHKLKLTLLRVKTGIEGQ